MPTRQRITWLHTQPEHYFNCMIDQMAEHSQFDVTAAFLWRGHGWYKEGAQPKRAKTIFLRPKPSQEGKIPTFLRSFHQDWQADLFSQPIDAMIVSGYGGATQRQVIQECRRRKIPVALFSDSNLRSQRGKSVQVRLWRTLKRRFLQPIIHNVDYILTANRLGIAYWRYYGAPSSKIVRCPYYADYQRIEAARNTTRTDVLSQFHLDPNRKHIVTAARLIPAKGLDLFIKAFRESNLAAKGWTYSIAGTGPLQEQLKSLAGPDLNDSIRFLGFVQPSNLLALIHHANLFALPSVYEPHGIVIQEALAAETPVLCSDVVGAAYDLVIPGQTGWLFRSENHPSLMKRLFEATGNESQLQALRPLARAHFESWLASSNPVNIAEHVLAQMLTPKSP